MDRASADASTADPAAPSAGTSADSPAARRSTDSSSIVGVRSGTVLDPKLVATFRAAAARTDIAHRVLMILESGQGSKPLASARQHRR